MKYNKTSTKDNLLVCDEYGCLVSYKNECFMVGFKSFRKLESLIVFS